MERELMRLFVVTLAASAFACPALASDHSRPNHRHWSGAAHANHLARFAARQRVGISGLAATVESDGAYTRQAEYRPRPDGSAGSRVARPERSLAGRESSHGALDAMIARHAQMNGVPESLVHRVVIRESRYNARAVGRGGALGLMQIKYATARAMGYTGSPSGLLDAETNLTYAVRYLAGAYRAAGGNANGAVSNYARGYYAAAKRQGFSPYAETRRSDRWAASYAAAQPIEQVAWDGTPVRRPSAVRGLRRY